MSESSTSERTRLIQIQGKSTTRDDDAIPIPHRKGYNRFAWIAILAFVAATSLIFFRIGKSSYHKLHNPYIKSGIRVQLQLEGGKFVRVADVLVATETIPWLAGSTFEVELGPNDCWRLKSMKTNRWVSYSNKSKNYFSASESKAHHALCFEVYQLPDQRAHLSLQVGNTNMWVTALELPDNRLGLTVTGSKEAKAVFHISSVNRLTGVNLGGWFIPGE